MRNINLAAVLWIVVFFLSAGLAQANNMRCGNSFIKIGEHAYLVQQKCGEPTSKMHIGYTMKEDGKREMAIEDWVYGPRDGGYYYFVTFIGGRVAKIASDRL
jgi:hypothetical protein